MEGRGGSSHRVTFIDAEMHAMVGLNVCRGVKWILTSRINTGGADMKDQLVASQIHRRVLFWRQEALKIKPSNVILLTAHYMYILDIHS